jgi:hypothetical protein
MVDNVFVEEAKERIVDDVIIVGINSVKGYTTKRHWKEHIAKLEGL